MRHAELVTGVSRPYLLNLFSSILQSFLWCNFEDSGSRDHGPGLVRFGHLKESLSYFIAIFFGTPRAIGSECRPNLVSVCHSCRCNPDEVSPITGRLHFFHCQTKGNNRSPFLRENSSDATMSGIRLLLAERSTVSGTLPLTPSTGQPSSHFTGTRYGMRPTAP